MAYNKKREERQKRTLVRLEKLLREAPNEVNAEYRIGVLKNQIKNLKANLGMEE